MGPEAPQYLAVIVLEGHLEEVVEFTNLDSHPAAEEAAWSAGPVASIGGTSGVPGAGPTPSGKVQQGIHRHPPQSDLKVQVRPGTVPGVITPAYHLTLGHPLAPPYIEGSQVTVGTGPAPTMVQLDVPTIGATGVAPNKGDRAGSGCQDRGPGADGYIYSQRMGRPEVGGDPPGQGPGPQQRRGRGRTWGGHIKARRNNARLLHSRISVAPKLPAQLL